MDYQKSNRNGLLHIDFLANDETYLDVVGQKLLLCERMAPAEGSIQIRIELNTGTLPSSELRNSHLVVNSSVIDVRKKRIESWIPQKSSQFLNLNRMLVQPLGALLQALEFQTIHGALVCDDRHVIAFLGTGGSGKSTSASMLSLGRYTLLCDDLFFVSHMNNGYQFAPLRTHVKISNKDRKQCFRDRKIETSSVMDLAFGREIVFMFPRYRELQKELGVRRISRKTAFENLIADNLAMETGQEDCKRGRVEIFDFLHRLVQDFSFFEVSYNDQNFTQLESRIHRALHL